jgi:predicted DNA-binding transcriptional regulator YafY
MSQSERHHRIVNMLRQHRVVPKAEFLEKLEISPATLKRDLEYLRNRLHTPVEWSRAEAGYRLAHDQARQRGDHEVPNLWFSAPEIHALLTMEQLLEGLNAGELLTPHIAPLRDRLTDMLGGADSGASEIRRRVRVVALANRAVEIPHFERIGSALVTRRRLLVDYFSRGTGATRQREVSPLRLIHYRDNWYLDAWCHLRRGLRSFAVDAVVDAAVLKTPAKEIDDAVLDATFNPGYGIFSGKRVQWARLRFTPERARWVAKEQWHPRQQTEWLADGRYLLKVPYADHRELMMDILKHGAHCEVLGPKSLREAVRREVEAMILRYGEEGVAGSSGEPAGG